MSLDLIDNTKIDELANQYKAGYSITEICFAYKIPVDSLLSVFSLLHIIDHHKHSKRFTQSERRRITISLKPPKPVKPPKSYNGYLKREIAKMEERCESDQYTEGQKMVMKSTIKRYKFIIRRRYTRYGVDNMVELIGV
jgi:hypothetical protein